MKKIKAKLKEARQLVDLIQSNAEKAIEKSKILLTNVKKTTLSFKETKQSFDDSKNSFERNNNSADKLTKAIADYIDNPTKQNLELVKNKNSIAIDRNNLFSNRVFICTRNFKNTKNNLLENKENILELTETLKKSKVSVNKLKNTYVELEEINQSKKIIKTLNNSTLKKPRIIFNILNTTPRPNCDEISKSIEEKEDQILNKEKSIADKTKEKEENQKYLDDTKEEYDKLKNKIEALIEDDPNSDSNNKYNKKIQEEIDRLLNIVAKIRILVIAYENANSWIEFYNLELQIIYSKYENNEFPNQEDIKEISRLQRGVKEEFEKISKITNNPDYTAYGTGREGQASLRILIDNLEKTKNKTTQYTLDELEYYNSIFVPLSEKRDKAEDKDDRLEIQILNLEFDIENLNKEISDLKEQLEDCAEPV